MPRKPRDLALDYTAKFGAQSPQERRQVYVSPAERSQRMIAIEQMLVAAAPLSMIEAACKEKFGMGRQAVATYIERVKGRWAQEAEQDRPQLKKLAVKRLHQHIRNAAAKGQFSAVAQLERLLSDIQGTKEAVEVNLNVNATIAEAVITVATSMTDEEQAALIAEQRRLLQLAADSPGKVVIDAPGESAEQAV